MWGGTSWKGGVVIDEILFEGNHALVAQDFELQFESLRCEVVIEVSLCVYSSLVRLVLYLNRYHT